jgi:hypothetical protein
MITDLYLGTIALTLLYVLSILGWGGLLSRLLQATGTFWQDLAMRLVVGCCGACLCLPGLLSVSRSDPAIRPSYLFPGLLSYLSSKQDWRGCPFPLCRFSAGCLSSRDSSGFWYLPGSCGTTSTLGIRYFL